MGGVAKRHGDTGVDYTYSFTTASASELDSVTMTVPAGTGGSPAVGTVTPPAMAGGTVSLTGDTLTYSFTPGTVEAGTAVSVEITGLANTSLGGSYTSDITTVDAGTPVDSGTTPAVTFSGTTLVSPQWAVSDTAPGGTGVDYTYSFTTASSSELDSVTMTVPAGTGGSPAVGTVTPPAMARGHRVPHGEHADLLVHAGNGRGGDRGVDRDHRAGEHLGGGQLHVGHHDRGCGHAGGLGDHAGGHLLRDDPGEPAVGSVRYGTRGDGRGLHVLVRHRVLVGAGFGDDDGACGDRRVAGGGHGHAAGDGAGAPCPSRGTR